MGFNSKFNMKTAENLSILTMHQDKHCTYFATLETHYFCQKIQKVYFEGWIGCLDILNAVLWSILNDLSMIYELRMQSMKYQQLTTLHQTYSIKMNTAWSESSIDTDSIMIDVQHKSTSNSLYYALITPTFIPHLFALSIEFQCCCCIQSIDDSKMLFDYNRLARFSQSRPFFVFKF